ncbi:chemotaxis protein [Desulfovibrio sp.]|uniref:chemotaxis protein n=1 Tax=Desulfovibrio sp. TaxID=885 RepID=UPI0025B7B093|nr:chemotaxis protein [Desulfovibrio sp.]MCI7568328.1 chemotaxis protein [Desulfovibrio sp.]
MAQTNILLEAGTNELEVVEFYLDEILQGDAVPSGLQPAQELADACAAKEAEEKGEQPAVYRGYYGVNVAKVLEIIRMPKVTELPEVQHPCVMGAFNLRSRIIPLVDLTMWLGKVGAPTPDAKTIVTEFNNVTTAFMVSGVNRIHRISWEEVEPPNKYVAAVTQSTIVGVVKLEGRIVFLLDLEKIVANLNPKLGLNLNSLGEDWDASKGYRALISDDSALVREMQRDLLEKAGFKVVSTTNGREAWDQLLEYKRMVEEEGRPLSDFVQVVVSDIEMPVMDGLNLTLRIKEDPLLKHLPVLLFSSLITDKLRHKGESVGADGQISKPQVGSLARRAVALIEARFDELQHTYASPAAQAQAEAHAHEQK